MIGVKPFGEHGILINWPAVIDPQQHREIVAFDHLLNHIFKDHLLETVVSYHSIGVYLKNKSTPTALIPEINELLAQSKKQENDTPSFLWEIPVCYTSKDALDLAAIAAQKNLTVDQLITLHTAPKYRIYFTGFLPGFLYLGGLDKRLHTPRKATPRPQLFAGAVGIAGNQTGIYPQSSPGGWQIIGRTPVSLFDPHKLPPSPFKAGDAIQFKAITPAKYDTIQSMVQDKVYIFSKTPYHD